MRRNSGLRCTNCTIEDNASNIAVLLQTNSDATIVDSGVTDGRVSCNNGSRVTLRNTPISSPVHSIGAAVTCLVNMEGGTLAGSIRAFFDT